MKIIKLNELDDISGEINKITKEEIENINGVEITTYLIKYDDTKW